MPVKTEYDSKSKTEDIKSLNNVLKTEDYVIYVYASWCGHCKNFNSTWDNFTKEMDNLKIKYVKIESEIFEKFRKENGGSIEREVHGYPTVCIHRFRNGKLEYIDFNQERTVENLVNFVEENIKQKGGKRKVRTQRKIRKRNKNSRKH
jgi:thiol-disulfide isomerase/thioredoxin